MAQRWVVKLGSSSITNGGVSLARERLNDWAAQISTLVREGHQVVLVSSGAVAAGMARLQQIDRPTSVAKLQAIAAIGQSDLVQAWQSTFSAYEMPVAQVLLNHADISNRERYLNARAAIQELLNLGAIPTVNENDSVATDEIRLGDNDTLAALVANLIDADGLLLLTDQEGLFDDNPNTNPQATLVREAHANAPELTQFAQGASSNVGTGGMATKVKAAQIASRSGADTIIASAFRENVIRDAVAHVSVGTLLSAEQKPISSRKQWLAGHLRVAGKITVDAGAARVLTDRGASLLPVGVTAVEGEFNRGANVAITDTSGEIIGHGLVNYAAADLIKIVGLDSMSAWRKLGYAGDKEVVHRDNLVIFQAP